MKNFAILFLMSFFIFSVTADEARHSTGYQIGDEVEDFNLLNVDGEMVSMSDFPEAKGFIIIFSCNHCPFVVTSEDRMIELHNKYASKAYPVIAINPNDPEYEERDSYENMIIRAQEKAFPFPYLVDETQEVAKTFGATRTPHVYLLQKNEDGILKVAYIGSIDDNTRDETNVTEKFLEDAIAALMNGETPDPEVTRAIGCTIKWKQ